MEAFFIPVPKSIPNELFQNHGRDYKDEILSCVEVALPNWNVKHLSVWSELVQATSMEVSVCDLEEVQETTLDAQFQELRSKIAFLEFDINTNLEALISF